MKYAVVAVLAVLCGTACAADRMITQSVDVRNAVVQPAAIALFRGESVTYTVTPVHGGTVSTNATCRWLATYTTNIMLSAIDATGTVTTAGVATFWLPASQTAMAAGQYDSFVSISDTGRVLVSSRSTLTVNKSPLVSPPIAAPVPLYLPTTAPDGVTVIYSNGILSAIAPAAPDLIARADIADHKTNATAHAAMGWVTATITNGLASTNWVKAQGYLTGELDTNALAQLAFETNRAIQAEALLYPRSNPSNWVDRAGATQGMQVAGAYLTNEPMWQSVSGAVVSGASLGATALQSEADTLATVQARGATISTGAVFGSGNIYQENVRFKSATGTYGRSPGITFDGPTRTNWFGMRTALAEGFVRIDPGTPTVAWSIYDASNFVAGVNYLAPTADAISAAGGTTGTVVRVEADPVWAAASNGVLYAAGGASGTNTTGSIFVNGKVTTVGTNTPWTAIGAVTNGGATINGSPITNGAAILVTAGASLSPWTNNVNAANYSLTNAAVVYFTNSAAFYATSTQFVFTIQGTNYVFP